MQSVSPTFHQRSKAESSLKLRAMYQKPVTQVSTAVLLTLFAIIFFAVFAIRPTLSTITELIKKIDDQKIIVEKLNKKSSALATAQSEYALVESKLPLVAAAIPPTHAMDLLLKQIEGTAAFLKLPINSLQVDTVTLPPDPTASRIVNGVVELPLSISFEADYQSLRQMTQMLSALSRFLSVESVTMTVAEGQDGAEVLRMSIAVFAYYLPPEGVISPS